MKIFVPALLAFGFSVSAGAALPAPVTTTKQNLEIDIAPEARTVWERAIGLYHQTNGLHLSWKQELDATSEFDFDRAGLLRLIDREFEEKIVVDGENKWTLDQSLDEPREPRSYTREKLEIKKREAYVKSISALTSSFGLGLEMAVLLDGGDETSINRIQSSANSARIILYRARLLPTKVWSGQPCDLLQITMSYLIPEEVDGRTTRQKTYWFSRSNSSLLRFQNSFFVKNKQPLDTDYRVVEQKFNPKFAPDTFKFTPPKGAKLSK